MVSYGAKDFRIDSSQIVSSAHFFFNQGNRIVNLYVGAPMHISESLI